MIMGYGTHSNGFTRVNTDKLPVWNISDPVLFDKDDILNVIIIFRGYNTFHPTNIPVVYTFNSSGQKQEISCTPDASPGRYRIPSDDLPKIKGSYHSLVFDFGYYPPCEIGDWLTFTVSADTGEGGSGDY